MRLGVFCNYLPPHVGGVERVVASEAVQLACRGVEVRVVTSSLASPGLDGVDVRRVPAWNGLEARTAIPYPLFAPDLVAQARAAARWADLVHVHDSLYLPSLAGALAAVRRRRPLVVTQHVGLVAHSQPAVEVVQRAGYLLLGDRVLRRADAVAAVNEDAAAFVGRRGVAAGRVVVLPNGVDTDRFRPVAGDAERAALRARLGLPPAGMVVLFVGRFVPKKGFDRLLAAADPRYLLVFAGGDAPAAAVSRSGVRWLGRLDHEELADVYRAADVLAAPSVGERSTLVMLEAMASGLPVVVSEAQPAAGVVFARPEPEALRDALLGLTADPARRAALGAAARAHAVAHGSWAAHTDRLLEVYEQARSRRR
ncbi:MAG TPA: glycosyltransferase family 4 protein [Acidimicrobiales bacterium]|nr:glycosyltransferase family 4 protein [Acidimicrobiales bacterium]